MNIEQKFQKDIPLSVHATLRIGGPARYFFIAQNKEDLISALKWAKQNRLKYLVLGNGSNLLFSDEGFNGLVIKNQTTEIQYQPEGDNLKVFCESGVLFSKIILETSSRGFSGLEWGFGIPGTIGGAICGNAGRLGRDISGAVEGVCILSEDLREIQLTKAEGDFNYRDSRFKRTGEIILSAVLKLEKKEKAKIDQLLEEAKKIVRHSPQFPSAGCAFKNYIVKEGDILLQTHPELKEKVRGGKIGVGFLIEQCGLKGKREAGAQVWEEHANYLLNMGGATAKDYLKLMDICQQAVWERFGVKLEPEVRIIEK